MSIDISVVIPTYRRTELLTKCLKALLVQKFDKSRYEIIVVSDGPDADTKKVFDDLAGYEFPRLSYLALPEKRGPAAARNYGWLNAKGQIIAFTDDDCIPDNYWISEIYKNAEADQDVAITGKVIVPINKRPTDHEQNTAGLQTADFITANCACTKKALEKAGGFDEQFSMAWREDSDLEFKLISKNIPVKHVDSAVVVHPVRQAKWGISIKEQKKTLYNALLYKKFPVLYRQRTNSRPPLIYYIIVLGFLLFIAGMITRHNNTMITGLAIWLLFTLWFAIKRLSGTSHKLDHVLEMLYTSAVIPFASIYWHFYGLVKFRVWFV
jgi:glycosyltransferase involved in cell wall biosynthesis